MLLLAYSRISYAFFHADPAMKLASTASMIRQATEHYLGQLLVPSTCVIPLKRACFNRYSPSIVLLFGIVEAILSRHIPCNYFCTCTPTNHFAFRVNGVSLKCFLLLFLPFKNSSYIDSRKKGTWCPN